jgi:hypothetical protein
MPDIHVTLLGRFPVTVGGAPVAEASWNRRHAAAVVKVLALPFPGPSLRRRDRGRRRKMETMTAAAPGLAAPDP